MASHGKPHVRVSAPLLVVGTASDQIDPVSHSRGGHITAFAWHGSPGDPFLSSLNSLRENLMNQIIYTVSLYIIYYMNFN